MAYEINIHVNKNGKLETEELPLSISVYRESKRVKLLFDVAVIICLTPLLLQDAEFLHSAYNFFLQFLIISFKIFDCDHLFFQCPKTFRGSPFTT